VLGGIAEFAVSLFVKVWKDELERATFERSVAVEVSVRSTEEHPSVAASLHELADRRWKPATVLDLIVHHSC